MSAPVVEAFGVVEPTFQCEMVCLRSGACPSVAEWIVRSSCRSCSTRWIDALCQSHRDDLVANLSGCAKCMTHTCGIDSVMPL